MHTKIFNTFLKIWVQFRVGAIPRLPESFFPLNKIDGNFGVNCCQKLDQVEKKNFSLKTLFMTKNSCGVARFSSLIYFYIELDLI